MSFTDLAGLAGIGFVLVGIAINIIFVRAGLPLPGSGKRLDEVTDAFVAIGDALKRPSVLAPALWLFLTVFAAGLLSILWPSGPETAGWALVGFAGVIMQNVTFTCVEALRFGIVSAATHDRASAAGLWGLSNVLFGFNQLFLAVALLGFTIAGAGAGLVLPWHAWLGYVSAALLFLSSSVSPFHVDGTSRIAIVGLIGWLGWAAWIITYSITMIRI